MRRGQGEQAHVVFGVWDWWIVISEHDGKIIGEAANIFFVRPSQNPSSRRIEKQPTEVPLKCSLFLLFEKKAVLPVFEVV